MLDTVSTSDGLKQLAGRSFEQVLHDHVEPWLTQVDQIFLSGMVTSRTGWVETPYVPCPTPCDGLIGQAITRQAFGKTLWFLPGLCQLSPDADVMRGEELQLYGLEAGRQRSFAVLPGTHSKWACLDGATVTCFRTIITGELFELLLNGSLTGQLAKGRVHNQTAFLDGVSKGAGTANLVASIFAIRAEMLLGQGAPENIASYLSGLLIGSEIREAKALFGTIDHPIKLLGGSELCARYQEALKLLDHHADIQDESTTARGFMRTEQQARALAA